MARALTELFDTLQVKKRCSSLFITPEQMDAAKEWIRLLDTGELKKEQKQITSELQSLMIKRTTRK